LVRDYSFKNIDISLSAQKRKIPLQRAQEEKVQTFNGLSVYASGRKNT
jgi:hypothetical protein